ncbi:MAG: LCP family protein [Chloroflexota bacterium]|nr:LCP family protein [Chloroflexota bacterium]
MSRHLNDRRLLTYLEEGFSPDAEAHLRVCPTCRARMETLARTAETLTVTLHAVGAQVPLSPARSWAAVARRRAQQRVAIPPLLRQLATMAVLVLVVAGLAGLIHTLAVTGPTLTEATPTPNPTSPANPSPVTGPLPRPSASGLSTPISILVLGADGESETSGETDTLILFYLDDEAKRAFLLSIPRNMYVQVPSHGQARAGSVYGLGERDEDTNGLALAQEAISITLGLPVQHAALVHFDGFASLVDVIGGLDVEVPHPIEDPTFPDVYDGYDPLLIPAGKQHFEGEVALRYARTRVVPAPGFDRTFRQQQLILAAHDRLTRLDLLPDLIAQAPTLWAAIADGFETDLSLSDVIDLALMATNLTTGNITTAALDECCTVQHTTPAGERVLLPQPEGIEALMENLLEGK